jgi:aminopeptidase N
MRPGLLAVLFSCGAMLASAVAPTIAERHSLGTAAAQLASQVGSNGAGDTYYPTDGNGGYNVLAYAVRVNYFPGSTSIVATTTVTARATLELTRFNLDLRGLRVSSVLVDGRRAGFSRQPPHELVIAPSRVLRKGHVFTVRVSYRGRPGVDPVDPIGSGWHDARTPGGGFIAGEPHSCTLWYPCNDHPTDKARFSLTATVPRPFAVVSNGAQLRTLSGRRPNGTPVRTFRWVLNEPTTTYLTTIYIDRLTFERSTLPSGVRVVTAYGPFLGNAPRLQRRLPAIIALLERKWGPYPAPQAGGIFVNGDVAFSLETFTRPLYSEGVDVATVVHENAHQWWGDNVSVRRWRDICLSECFASYSEWLWSERNGANLDRHYKSSLRSLSFMFAHPLYDMGAGREFEYYGVYVKGKYFVHALRAKLGDARFYRSMRAIQTNRAVGHLSMLELRDLLEARTGVDLTSFWDEWVLSTGRPSDGNLFPGRLG